MREATSREMDNAAALSHLMTMVHEISRLNQRRDLVVEDLVRSVKSNDEELRDQNQRLRDMSDDLMAAVLSPRANSTAYQSPAGQSGRYRSASARVKKDAENRLDEDRPTANEVAYVPADRREKPSERSALPDTNTGAPEDTRANFEQTRSSSEPPRRPKVRTSPDVEDQRQRDDDLNAYWRTEQRYRDDDGERKRTDARRTDSHRFVDDRDERARTGTRASPPTGGGDAYSRLPGLPLLSRTSYLLNPFAGLRFRGTGNPLHPMRFLERFKKIARDEDKDDRDKLTYFATCLTERAAGWWSLQRPSFPHAKELFKERFWSLETQLEQRRRLLLDRYSRDSGISMADYAIDRYLESVFFEPPMQESEIVSILIGHFPPRVSLDLEARVIMTIDSLSKNLVRLENVYAKNGLDIYCMGTGELTVKAPTVPDPVSGIASGKSKKKKWSKPEPKKTSFEAPLQQARSREPSPAPTVDRGRKPFRGLSPAGSLRGTSPASFRGQTVGPGRENVGVIDDPLTIVRPGTRALRSRLKEDDYGRPVVKIAIKSPLISSTVQRFSTRARPHRW